MEHTTNFHGYRWSGLSTFPEGTLWHERATELHRRIDWEALCAYSSGAQHGERCSLDPQIGMGGRHMVRILNLEKGFRWIARLRMTSADTEDQRREACFLLQREVDCMRHVQSRTTVPVPADFAYVANCDNPIGAPFMLMECLPGKAAIDLEFQGIPTPYRCSFSADIAKFQVRRASNLLRLPLLTTSRRRSPL